MNVHACVYLCVYMHVCGCAPYLECSQRTAQQLFLSFHHVGLDNQTQVRLGGKHLDPLSQILIHWPEILFKVELAHFSLSLNSPPSLRPLD